MTWDGRYSLEELEWRIPPLPTLVADDQELPYKEHTGPFNPHSGTPLALGDQERLAQFLKECGLRRIGDGRFAGPCPLPHKDGPSTGESPFYCSPITAFWHCFGSGHAGNINGGVASLALVGFECESVPSDALSFDEINALLGQGVPQEFSRQSLDTNVPDRVRRDRNPYTLSGTFPRKDRDRGKRPSLWGDAITLFPYQKGITPLVKSTAMYSERTQQLAMADLLSHTWRNPINAQFKRRKAFFNMLPKMRRGEVYLRRVAVDDMDEKTHERLTKQLERAGAEWANFDNGLSHGHYLYLANVRLKGWEMVSDVASVLVDVLKGISPPGRDEDKERDRFRPLGGSRGWYGGAMKSPEEDAGHWHVIAKSVSPTDWIQVEAELVASGIRYQQVDPYWKRSQSGPGIVADYATEESALDFVVSIGYIPRATKSAGAAI